MRDRAVGMNSRRDNRTPSIGRRLATVGAVSMTVLLLFTSAPPVNANVFGQLGKMYGCVVTWGQVCDLSETVIGTGQPAQPIPVTCAQPLLNGLPQFLTWPKGSAKYRFQGTCSSPAKPGAVMTIRWEGSWTPSETQRDKSNASETLEITGYEPFFPDRTPGGKIFMYWTARCTKDPWLQAGGCNPFGAYVPDDLRQALPDIDKQSFPRTGKIISAVDKRQLSAEYEQVNPSYFSKFGIEPRMSSKVLQAPISQSAAAVGKPSSQFNIFSRGTESAEQAQSETLQQQGKTASSEEVQVTYPENDPDSLAGAAAITLDRPLHFMSANGEDALVKAGQYGIEPIMDLQLALSGEGQAPVLLQAISSTHTETVAQATALLVRGAQEDQWHLVYVTPDGMRLDAVGSTSGISSRGGSGIFSLRDRARFYGKISQSSEASSMTTDGSAPSPYLSVELQRLAAEQQRAKAELDPAALLARIKLLEWTLSCMYIDGFGTTYGPAFPSPKVYPAQTPDVRWNGMKCPGK